MQISDEAYKKLVLEVAAARGMGDAPAPPQKLGLIRRVCGLIVGALWLILISVVIAAFAFALRVQYGVPIPLPDSLVRTAAVTFSTAAAPLPTARVEQNRPSNSLPGIIGAPAWPTLTMTQEAATVEALPTATPPAHLVLSKPGDNPGFNSQVEPGNQPTPVVGGADPGDDAPPPSLYSVEDRVFVPAVLPTAGVHDNPGFDASSEPGSEPTPVQ